MARPFRFALRTLSVGLLVVVVAARPLGADTLPERLTDGEFWTLISSVSEPDGHFRSDNLLSNEPRLQHVIPGLARVVTPGRVYMGVGPEQNFTLISALRPAMAFIVDVRRGNLDLHLMYKALFELSADRADFVSRLFARPRPAGLTATTSSAEMFAAFEHVEMREPLYLDTMRAIEDQLITHHGFHLSADDLGGIEYAYHAFVQYGPDLRYSSTGGVGGRVQPSYAELMKGTDANGAAHGFLSSEGAFAVLKNLETRNLIVPVVGNFAGPTTIRAVAAYVRERGTTVSAFYLSNVEQYLWQDRLLGAFCANVATLPIDETSTFIHAVAGRPRVGLVPQLGVMAHEIESCR